MAAPLVLIVDPNAQVQCALARALREAGYRILEATTVDSACAMLETVAPRLVLVDGDGRPTGAELIRWVRRSGRLATQELPVIGLSGSDREGQELLGAGASRVLRKPLGHQALVHAVGEALPRAEAGP